MTLKASGGGGTSMGRHKASVHLGKIPQAAIVQKMMKSLSKLSLEGSCSNLGTKAESGPACWDGRKEAVLRTGHKVKPAGDSDLIDVNAEK